MVLFIRSDWGLSLGSPNLVMLIRILLLLSILVYFQLLY